jgi:outer membrane beta-barrel protein
MRKLLITALMLLAFASSALAVDLGGEPVIRTRKLWRDGRHELTPQFGVTVLDHYRQHFLLGIGYRFFPLEWLGVGAEGLFAMGRDTGLTSDIKSEYATLRPDFEVKTSSIQFLLNAVVELTPLSGKALVLDDLLVYYDIHFLGGAGFASVRGDFPKQGFSPMFGAGTRFFITPGIGITLDVRDYLVSFIESGSAPRPLGQSDLVKSADYHHNVAIMLGVDFLIPYDLGKPGR